MDNNTTDNNATLNIDALTSTRQMLLTNALASHSVELSGGKFSTLSRDSLATIGLTPIEIAALEQANGTGSGGTMTLLIADCAIPSSGNNPFSKEKWNMELQRYLHDTNPTLAKQLMKEAGVLK
jgi:hypothetical protein